MEKYITLIVKDSENPELEVEEKFQIYTTDSLETIKNRYFQLKKIVPPIGSFEILKKENELSEESSQPIKKLSDLGETIVKDVPVILLFEVIEPVTSKLFPNTILVPPELKNLAVPSCMLTFPLIEIKPLVGSNNKSPPPEDFNSISPSTV